MRTSEGLIFVELVANGRTVLLELTSVRFESMYNPNEGEQNTLVAALCSQLSKFFHVTFNKQPKVTLCTVASAVAWHCSSSVRSLQPSNILVSQTDWTLALYC